MASRDTVQCCLGRQMHMENDVRPATADLRMIDNRDAGGRSTRQYRWRMSRGGGVKQIRRVLEQGDLIIGVECLARVAVHQQHVTADCQHTEWEPSRLVLIRLQKRNFA